MSKIKQRRVLNSVLVVIIAFLFGLISLFALLPKTNVFAQADSGSDADVGNYSSMSTDVIYQIVTDRFVDGDPSNNPTGEIYDKNNLRKYHGGLGRNYTKIERKLFHKYGCYGFMDFFAGTEQRLYRSVKWMCALSRILGP